MIKWALYIAAVVGFAVAISTCASSVFTTVAGALQ